MSQFSQFRSVIIPLIRLAKGGIFEPLQDITRGDLVRSCDCVLRSAFVFRDQGHGEAEGLSTYAHARLNDKAVAELAIVTALVVEAVEQNAEPNHHQFIKLIETTRNGQIQEQQTSDKPDQELIGVLRTINVPEAARGAIALRANLVMLLGELDPVAPEAVDPAPVDDPVIPDAKPDDPVINSVASTGSNDAPTGSSDATSSSGGEASSETPTPSASSASPGNPGAPKPLV